MEKRRPRILGRPLHGGIAGLLFVDGSGSCDMGCRNTSLQRQILLLCNFHQRFGHYSLQPQRCYTATRFAYIGVRHPDGPYRPVSRADYLPADRPTLDGTFCLEADSVPYMVFCGEWIFNDNGTMEAQRLSSDLSHPVGESELLFRASDSPWSRELIDGRIVPNRVTDGPWLFRTGTGRLGMIWTSWIYNVYTMGVAYSLSGRIEGPWEQEPEPLTPPDHGHGMIFRDFSGRHICRCTATATTTDTISAARCSLKSTCRATDLPWDKNYRLRPADCCSTDSLSVPHSKLYSDRMLTPINNMTNILFMVSPIQLKREYVSV